MEWAMEFGIFNLMGSRDPEKRTAEVFAEVAEQTRLADELGYTIAWFAEHHFSNYCLCASPLMLVAHCASITKTIRLGTAVVVLPLYNPARLLAEIATVIERAPDARRRRRLPALRIRAVRRRYQSQSGDDRRVLRHPRPCLFRRFLQLQRQALSDPEDSYPGSAGAQTPPDLWRRPCRGDAP